MPPYSLSPETIARDRGAHPAHRRSPRRPRPHQRAVRGQGQPGVRDRGQPAGLAHRAVRGQGHGRAAGEGRRPGDARRHAGRAARPRACCVPPVDGRPRRGEGGGAAVQPLPRRRPRARPGDALDRRGDGHRHAPSGWPSPRARWRPATVCPSSGTVFISVADRDKALAVEAARQLRPARLRDRRHRRHRRRARGRAASRSRPAWPSSGSRRAPTAVDLIEAGEITSS